MYIAINIYPQFEEVCSDLIAAIWVCVLEFKKYYVYANFHLFVISNLNFSYNSFIPFKKMYHQFKEFSCSKDMLFTVINPNQRQKWAEVGINEY